jgi:hypothetical protein
MPIRIRTEVKSLIQIFMETKKEKNEKKWQGKWQKRRRKNSDISDLAFSMVKHMGGVKRTTFLCVPVIATSTRFSISPYISCNKDGIPLWRGA